MSPALELAQAMIDFLSFFVLPFIVFLVIEWLLDLFRRG